MQRRGDGRCRGRETGDGKEGMKDGEVKVEREGDGERGE
mgnify:CR=1 FL=1